MATLPRRSSSGSALGVDAAIGLGVHSADEERGHRRQPVDGLPGARASLQRPHERLRHLAVVLQREEQGDVDVDALGEEALDRRPAFPGPGHLDHHVRPVHLGPEPPALGDRPLGVAGERGRDLQRDEAVPALGRVVHRAEEVGRLADVLHGELLEDLQVALRRCGERSQRGVVVAAPADGMLEDGGVRGHAAEAVVDQRLQLPRAQHPATQIVQPHALPQLEQRLHGGLGGSLGHVGSFHVSILPATAAAPSSATFGFMITCTGIRDEQPGQPPLVPERLEKRAALEPLHDPRGDAAPEVHATGRDHREGQVPCLGSQNLTEEIQRPVGQAVGAVEGVPDDHRGGIFLAHLGSAPSPVPAPPRRRGDSGRC